MGYSVGQVARLAKVTVRTLHHYDEVGLLSPGERTPSGYRRYDDADLDRLQQILFYRRLGFSLDDIASVLDDPDTGPSEHLRRQHRLLTEQITRLQEMAAAVERAMEARKMGINLSPEEKFEIFGEDYSEDYEAEAEQRWGDSEAWRQSQQRTARYGKEDWVRIKEEADDLNRRLAEAMAAGHARTARRPWRWRRSTGGPSRTPSTTAPTPSTGGSPGCTWPTRGSPGPMRRCGPAWRSGCTTP